MHAGKSPLETIRFLHAAIFSEQKRLQLEKQAFKDGRTDIFFLQHPIQPGSCTYGFRFLPRGHELYNLLEAFQVILAMCFSAECTLVETKICL